jgi:hypothetical protein
VEINPKLAPKMIDINSGLPLDIQMYDEPPNKGILLFYYLLLLLSLSKIGRILIDGLDISKIAMSRVRSSIAIIPQDPTLFTGTVRYNLGIIRCYKCYYSLFG